MKNKCQTKRKTGFLLDDGEGLHHFILTGTLPAALKVLKKKLITEMCSSKPTAEDMKVIEEQLAYAKEHFSVFEGAGSYLWQTIDSPADGPLSIGKENWKKLTGRNDPMPWEINR